MIKKKQKIAINNGNESSSAAKVLTETLSVFKLTLGRRDVRGPVMRSLTSEKEGL